MAATAGGAFAAWFLGMIPSTVMNLTAAATAAPSGEMNDLVVYGRAARMGLVLGPLLGLPQWFVLRRTVPHAGWWLPANAAAWALGMVVVFVGVGAVFTAGNIWSAVGLGLLTLLSAGATVGAVHGLALIWLLRRPAPAR